MGDDVATSFEGNGELIMMFGDTIGATAAYNPTYIGFLNSFDWNAHDPIARSTTQHAEDGLLINFFMSGNHALEVAPPPQPDGTPVDMGAFNVPNGGITLNGQIYISVKTGHSMDSAGNGTDTTDYAVLAKFNETTQAFTTGRTTSPAGGQFTTVSFYEAPMGTLGTPAPVLPEPVVAMFGLGLYRASNIYLSLIPSTEFESGVDSSGNSATRYFTGISNGQPTWSTNESAAVPVVTDVNPANPSIGNLSVFYSQQLGLWLMTFDGGKGSDATVGSLFYLLLRNPGAPGARRTGSSTTAATRRWEISFTTTTRPRPGTLAPVPCPPASPRPPTPPVPPAPRSIRQETILRPQRAADMRLKWFSASPRSPAAR